MRTTLLQVLLDEAKCLAGLRRLRWPGGLRCPHCGGDRFWTDREEEPKLQYRCGECGGWWSDLSATALEGTRLPLACWLLAVDGLGRGQSDLAVAATLGVHRHTVARMRRALGGDPATHVLLQRLAASFYLSGPTGSRRKKPSVVLGKTGRRIATDSR